MPVDTSFEGRSYPPSAPIEVTRESIREFASAVGADSPLHHDPAVARAAGHRDVVAPPTYAVVIAQRCEAQYVQDPAAGVDFSRVVHAEEQFDHVRPIEAGMAVVGILHVDRVREVAGQAMLTTRVELAEDTPASSPRPLAVVTSTLLVRGTAA